MSNSLYKQISDWVEGLNYRRIVFALSMAEIMFDERFDLRTDKDYLLVILQKRIKDEEELRDLKSRVIENSVPDDCVDWVHRSKRHELWFANHEEILNTFSNIKTDILPNYFKNLICEIDSCHRIDNCKQVDFDLNYKIYLYNKVKKDYECTLQYLKHFDWIKKDDENLLNWCLGYLDNKRLLPKYGLTYPDNLADKYDVIMVSIQLTWNYSYYTEYQIFKEKMHKAWTQKKWRDKKDTESALEYILSRKQFLKMLEISDKHKSKPIDVLNNWIDAEYKKLD
ncbi:hypothetical protein [Moraxella pluranimalium]|uniref:Uncharacterized protein n=1 Tax=Moraxella pluranimalium TaxID=470453 RepID=A0A1T0CMC4_9GAMM|nr:hypothetical protein [Moraxella pluranimalium]OOS23465.1 hypothetical protein B0680_06945 [Moraxella pluranimalium]